MGRVVESRILSTYVYWHHPKKDENMYSSRKKMFGTSFGRSWDMKNRPFIWSDFPDKSRKTGIMGMPTMRW